MLRNITNVNEPRKLTFRERKTLFNSWVPAEFFVGGSKFLVGQVNVLQCLFNLLDLSLINTIR